jgi:hypothetical protein
MTGGKRKEGQRQRRWISEAIRARVAARDKDGFVTGARRLRRLLLMPEGCRQGEI